MYSHLDRLFANFLVNIIRIYQKTLSPDHGFFKYRKPYGHCRFFPTCSEYAVAALKKYGAIKGSWLMAVRILRCNPWNQGGYDPLK